MPLVLKGVGRAEDALRAAESGIQGIVVSNHGGRNMDGGPASADVLLQVTDTLRDAGRLNLPGNPAVGGGIEVYCDGGIRRGKDILRALSLGATAVFVGRPHQWGLSVGGQAGVERVIEIYREELTSVMQLAGCATVSELSRDCVMIKQADLYSRL